MPWTKEEKSVYMKEYNKIYYAKNKTKHQESNKLYRIENREKMNENNRLYRIENREKMNEKVRLKYVENKHNPEFIKKRTIESWINQGLISGNYDEIYERYLNCKNCEECGCEFSIRGDGEGRWKDMDHCHETNLFRNVLCHVCNLRRR